MTAEKLNSTVGSMTIGLAVGAGMGILMSIVANNDVFLAVGIVIGGGIGASLAQTTEERKEN